MASQAILARFTAMLKREVGRMHREKALDPVTGELVAVKNATRQPTNREARAAKAEVKEEPKVEAKPEPKSEPKPKEVVPALSGVAANPKAAPKKAAPKK